MNSFLWWHKIRGHKIVRTVAERTCETLIFADCHTCSDDRGWVVDIIPKVPAHER